MRKNLRLGRRLAERLERVRFRRRDLQRHFAWKDRRNLLARHVPNMCRLLGLDGEAVEYVVVLVACDLDDFADEDSVGADDIPALLDLQPRDRVSHAGSSPDGRAETSAATRGQASNLIAGWPFVSRQLGHATPAAALNVLPAATARVELVSDHDIADGHSLEVC